MNVELYEFPNEAMHGFVPQGELLDRHQADYDYHGAFAQDIDMADVTKRHSAVRVG